MCPFCTGHITGADRGQYRGIPGEKDQPIEWRACHITCARRNQECGMPITVRWYPPKTP